LKALLSRKAGRWIGCHPCASAENDPASKNILNAWVNQAQPHVGLDTGGPGWLIASTVVVAALQRAIDEDGRARFLLKGGTYLQHRLSWSGRPTKDIDVSPVG
jgi:hypothetical protein